MRRSKSGFTLIEMAITVAILGLVAAAAVKIIKPLQDIRKTDVTLAHLKVVDKALQLYVIRNGCLPCPADGSQASSVTTPIGAVNYSLAGVAYAGSPGYISGCTSSACQATARTVPWIALGLSEDDASDGWGDRIRYVVAGTQPVSCSSTAITAANGMIRCATAGTDAFPTGGVTVIDNDAATTTTAAYVLISSGPDRASARQAYTGVTTGNTASGVQASNAQDTVFTPFYKGTLNALSGASHFDDLVLFKTPSLLILTCGADACGNPA
jgi:prepilin-type N-terminal cleavage/methylation domain-containing protein